ncbi:MAG: hypothetical protein QM804_13905 [Propionicimonas sp.]
MIEGRPSVDQLVELTSGERDSVTIYQPVLLPVPAWDTEVTQRALTAAMATAMTRLVGRGAGHDTHWAIRQQFDRLTKGVGYRGRTVALFLTAESAVGYLLPDLVEPTVRVADHFELGPLLRAITMAGPVYGLTITEHDWGLWEATGTQPAQLVAGSSRETDGTTGLRAGLFRLFRWLGAGSSYFLSRDAFISRALRRAGQRLDALDPSRAGQLVLFPDDALTAGRSFGGRVEDARLGRPVEVVYGDADGLTPGRIARELRRRQRRHAQQELSRRIALLRAEHADGYPSADLAEIALAAAAGRVRTFIYDATADHHGRLDRSTGRFEPDQWGYDVLARIAVDVLAGGGEAYAVTPDELLSGAMTTAVLAEIAYPDTDPG